MYMTACVQICISQYMQTMVISSHTVPFICIPIWGTKAQILNPNVNEHADGLPSTLALALYTQWSFPMWINLRPRSIGIKLGNRNMGAMFSEKVPG